VEDVSLTRSYETYAPSLDEILERIWGNFGRAARPKAERVESLTVDVPLTHEQALHGGEVRILVPAETACPTCRGHGGVGEYECWRCRGGGFLRDEVPVAVPFPRGVVGSHVVEVPLDGLGIDNLYLRVLFRPE
jgi:DnaJ-class molecular chaperone